MEASRRCLLCLLALLALAPAAGAQAAGPGLPSPAAPARLRISLENARTHVQSEILRDFAERLRERSGGAILAEVFDGAALFRDSDVVTAVARGGVEMACPGIWNLERFDSGFAALLLPRLYGREVEAHHRLVDGGFGRGLFEGLDQKYGIKVLGRAIDLGYAHLFTVRKPLRAAAELAGLRIRVAGGRMNELKLGAFGASAQTIAWPDFPARLERGEVDGVLTTYETILSAKLWEKGISQVYESRVYFPMYLPIVNGRFLESLGPELSALLLETWESGVEAARLRAAEAQKAAREECLRRGIQAFSPSAAQIGAEREALAAREAEFASRVGLSPEAYRRFLEELPAP